MLISLDAGDNIAITYNGAGYFLETFWTFDLVGEAYAVLFHSAIPARTAPSTTRPTAWRRPHRHQDAWARTSSAPTVRCWWAAHAGSIYGDMMARPPVCLLNRGRGELVRLHHDAGNLVTLIAPTVAGTNWTLNMRFLLVY